MNIAIYPRFGDEIKDIYNSVLNLYDSCASQYMKIVQEEKRAELENHIKNKLHEMF